MRRFPSLVWVALPLALALVYAVAYPLWAPTPTVENVVPPGAVVTARFRGLAGLDALWCFGRAPGVRPSEDLAERHNVPGFPGLDRSGPIHWVLLPRGGRADATLLILPLDDADRLEARFRLEDGVFDAARSLRRHAKHLEVRGDFAALAWDREIVRHLGEGGLTLPDRGEDFGLAVDVPGAVALAASQVGQEPWRSILVALGATPGAADHARDPVTGESATGFFAGRTQRVAEAWRRASMWAWSASRRVEAELEPTPGTLAERLAAFTAAAGPLPSMEVGTGTGAPQAVLHVPSPAAFDVLALALRDVGVKLPELPRAAGGEAPFLARAFGNGSDGLAWTLELAAPPPYDAALAALLGELPAPGAARPLAAGEAPATVATTQQPHVPPSGHVARSGDGARLLVGADAERLAEGRAPAPAPAGTLAAPDLGGRRLLAIATLNADRALSLLGPALQPGGLLGALGPGALRVVLSTNGRTLHVAIERLP